jgi:hypothetical protein
MTLPSRDYEAVLDAMYVSLGQYFDWVREIERDTSGRALPFLGNALNRLEQAQDEVGAARRAMMEERGA